MPQRLKKFFLANKETGELPIFLSPFASALLGVLASALILLPASFHSYELAQLIGGTAFDPADVIRLVNSSRSETGLASLKENGVLDAAALTKAQDMASLDYFSHVSPGGKTPWDFIRGAGYKYMAAGENLALDYTTAESAHQALMASPTHRANILNKLYAEIGVSVVSGTYEGRPSVFLVEYFGKPLSSAIQSPKITGLAGVKTLAKLPFGSQNQISPKTATRGQEVLGAQVKTPALTIADQPVLGPDLTVRLWGTIVTFLLLLTLALALVRLGALPFMVMAKTIILVLIFGYVATHNIVLK